MVQSQSVIEQLTIAFDYAALDTETRIVVQQRTTEIKALMKRAASDIIEIGQKLIEVKVKLDHGEFTPWLRTEFDWSWDTARRFMRVAEVFQNQQIADFQIAPSALYLLAAPSTPESARIEAIGRADAGESISHAAAREIISYHRPPREIVVTSDDGETETTDDVWDAPIEPAQARDLFPRQAPATEPPAAAHDPHERRAHIMRVMGSSESPEWYTPEKVIRLVIDVFGQIDLDPCSNSDDPARANVPAQHYHTAATNGLIQRWFGNVYMNPPYGDEIPPWIERLVSAYKSGEITQAIALVPGRIDTVWFQPLWDYPLCFVRGRLRFSGSKDSAPFPSVLAYLGPDSDLFMDTFEQIGRCGVLR